MLCETCNVRLYFGMLKGLRGVVMAKLAKCDRGLLIDLIIVNIDIVLLSLWVCYCLGLICKTGHA